MDRNTTQQVVREAYGRIARGESGCGCGPGERDVAAAAKAIGYVDAELNVLPDGTNLGLGCGNPTGIAGLREGETVLDLGAGAGIDCFLAAAAVGPHGRVIGVDMTPAMVRRARAGAQAQGAANVEFRLGAIEQLPVRDATVDVVISNCVINLAADKPQVFREIVRVLKPGGRIAISDIALRRPLPRRMRESVEAYVGCVSGALLLEDYARLVEAAGLTDVRVTAKSADACIARGTPDPLGQALLEGVEDPATLDGYAVSIDVAGRKP